MSVRRKSHPVVTLFAFQDVIMSVSGIIIVLVLLLSLELIQRPEPSAAAASAQAAAQLQRELARAQASLAELEQLVLEIDAQIEDSGGLSAAELQRQTDITTADTAQLTAEIAALQAQVDTLEQTDRELRAQSFDQQDMRRQIDAAQRQAAELEQTLDDERSDNRPLFSLPHGFSKEGWLAVLSATDVAVAPLGRARRPQVFAADGGMFGDSAGKKFMNWTRTQSASSLYVLLLIRPDGVSTFDEIAAELDESGIAYGFDLAPAGQVLLHPERGASE